MVKRGQGNDIVLVEIRNDGSSPEEEAYIQLPTGVVAVEARLVSGAGGSCNPVFQGQSVTCVFTGPAFWAGGATIVIELKTSPRMPDN